MSDLFTATEQHGQNVTPFVFVYASFALARRAVEQSAEGSGQTITGWNCYRAGFENIAIFDGGSYIITQCELDAGGPENLTTEQVNALKMFATDMAAAGRTAFRITGKMPAHRPPCTVFATPTAPRGCAGSALPVWRAHHEAPPCPPPDPVPLLTFRDG